MINFEGVPLFESADNRFFIVKNEEIVSISDGATIPSDSKVLIFLMNDVLTKFETLTILFIKMDRKVHQQR